MAGAKGALRPDSREKSITPPVECHSGPARAPADKGTVKDLRAVALTLALAAAAAADDVAIPMADGNVLRGERVEDPAVAGKGVRVKTGGVTVFVPWSEMAAGAREALERGLSPGAPHTAPPVAPAAGDVPPLPAAAAPEALPEADGQPPPLPDCCDPRF